MADEKTKKLLVEWGFAEFVHVFEEQEINEDVLDCLTEDNLKSLLPTVGKRLYFLKKIKEHKSASQIEDILNNIIILPSSDSTASTPTVTTYTDTAAIRFPNEGTPSTSSTASFDSEAYSLSDIDSPIPNSILDANESAAENYNLATAPSKSFYGVAEFKKACRSSYHLNLKRFLEQSNAGKFVLNSYQEKRILVNKTRNILVDLLVNGIVSSSVGSLGNADFENLSQKICDLFPTECQSTYYIPPISAKYSATKKAINAKGKIPDKYRKLRGIN